MCLRCSVQHYLFTSESPVGPTRRAPESRPLARLGSMTLAGRGPRPWSRQPISRSRDDKEECEGWTDAYTTTTTEPLTLPQWTRCTQYPCRCTPKRKTLPVRLMLSATPRSALSRIQRLQARTETFSAVLSASTHTIANVFRYTHRYRNARAVWWARPTTSHKAVTLLPGRATVPQARGNAGPFFSPPAKRPSNARVGPRKTWWAPKDQTAYRPAMIPRVLRMWVYGVYSAEQSKAMQNRLDGPAMHAHSTALEYIP
nr:hypothetical protein CFP56_32482 [Quercus suber]